MSWGGWNVVCRFIATLYSELSFRIWNKPRPPNPSTFSVFKAWFLWALLGMTDAQHRQILSVVSRHIKHMLQKSWPRKTSNWCHWLPLIIIIVHLWSVNNLWKEHSSVALFMDVAKSQLPANFTVRKRSYYWMKFIQNAK